jgi:hypothetical protein
MQLEAHALHPIVDPEQPARIMNVDIGNHAVDIRTDLEDTNHGESA